MPRITRSTSSSGLTSVCRLEVFAAEGHAGLGNGGLQGAKIPQPRTSTGLIKKPLVEGQHLAQAEVAHLGQAAIELGILL